jgi:sodium/bile acid cotransporter 3/5
MYYFIFVLLFLPVCFINCTPTINETTFDFDQKNIQLNQGKFATIRANITVPVQHGKDRPSYNSIRVTNLKRKNVRLVNGTYANLEWSIVEDKEIYVAEFEFGLEGVFVGYGEITFEIFDTVTNQSYEKIFLYKIPIIRTNAFNMLSSIFTATMTILICINTFVMGLQLDWKLILGVLRRPIAPTIGFCCQFIIMPLLAFLWASLLLPNQPNLQFGYFAIGCAPGGGNSNFWTLLLDGNLDLSVTMTFCSNVAALAMMPFWLFTLGQMFFKQLGGHMQIPFTNIILSLGFLIVPCCLGILVKHYKPHLAEKSKKVIKYTTSFVIIVAICFGTAANIYVYSLITAKTLLCGFLLPWGGFALSYAVAFVLRQNHVNCRTIAIETGIQNAGIAIILLSYSLNKPESDLALVMPVCVLIFTPIPLIFCFIFKTAYNCMKAKRDLDESEKEQHAGKGQNDKEMEIKWSSPIVTNVNGEKPPKQAPEKEPML